MFSDADFSAFKIPGKHGILFFTFTGIGPPLSGGACLRLKPDLKFETFQHLLVEEVPGEHKSSFFKLLAFPGHSCFLSPTILAIRSECSNFLSRMVPNLATDCDFSD